MTLRRFASAVALALLAGLAVAAVDPDEAFLGKRRSFWSFQKPQRPPVPNVPGVAHPVDAFLREATAKKHLTPAPPLPKAALIRRLTLDLTGLPPTPEEVRTFVADRRADAYERLVDRLLASPAYGERWAQRWLDVVRYADTNGYELDAERPHAWRYRDYVVRSFQQDKPYFRFLQEQIAGDELWPGNKEALVATGLHRAGPIHLVGGNQDEEMNRQEVLTEMTATVGSAFLGLTVNCARCHNHKFDPILQADYYRLQAVFAATEGKDIPIATDNEKRLHEQAEAAYQKQLEPIKKAIEEIEKPYRERIRETKKARLAPELRAALDTPAETRTEEQKRLAKDAKEQVSATWDEVVNSLSVEDRQRRAGLRRQMHQLALTRPDPLPTAYAVTNGDKLPPTHILKVGDHKHKLAMVQAGVPKVFNAAMAFPDQPKGLRARLAEWLASPEHPLTARVMVNRIWQFRMGAGLVRTPNDFGVLGERPTHPALLDWLTTEFVARGTSVKALDRLILLSQAYRQQATASAEAKAADPDNKLYSHAHRRRLESEQVRDAILAVSGSLNPEAGGKPVKVALEPEVYDLIFTEDEPDNLWPLHPDARQQDRRSLYLLNKRTVRLPMLANFDQPDGMTSCPVRPSSTHALQALSLLNSPFLQQQAQRFAERLEREAPKNPRRQVRRAYELALARAPRPEEERMARDFFAGGGPLLDFCVAMLNRNEFLYLP